MFQVAVYGKGGIGKSTMSANISVALAGEGKKVMQIGCDPKHDSTRLLLDGQAQRTVLDYVREVPIGKRRLEDVIVTGTSGILCTEAGGPEPGIGCAGRGILTTFDTLRKLGADDLDVDVRIYDVLGDVVCGGFAVPLRSEYADAVILVTSGEFMALYAANNIMRGMMNFETSRPRLLGIVFNSRGGEGEKEAVESFAEAAGTEIIAEIPRDHLFADAEAAGHTVMELHPESDAASQIRRIADRITQAMSGDPVLRDPIPLDEKQMSDLAAGRPIRLRSEEDSSRIPTCTGCSRRTTIKGTRIMSSCAAYGAVAAYCRLEDTAVLVHGPESCAYLMATTRAKEILDLYEEGLYDRPPVNNIRTTRMCDSASIFGGGKFLREGLEKAVEDGFDRIAVITTCMPGIIGDDHQGIADSFKASHPGVSVTVVPTDGDITGDYTDGFMMAAELISERIDPSVPREEGYVNLIAPSFFDIQSRSHRKALDDMLSAFGLRVNCRFLDDCSPNPPELFCRAMTDIMMSDTKGARELMGMVTRRTEREPFPAVMPVGIHEYIEWIRRMGEFTGKNEEAEREVVRAEKEYRSLVEVHRPRMEGVRVMVTWKIGANPDWLIDTLNDLGAEILKVGFAPSPRKAGSTPDSRYDVVTDYTDDDLARDLEELRPDLLISDIIKPVPEGISYAKLSRIGVGYRQVFEYIQYLENTMRLPEIEGWREGREI